jgi:hypothetical protein
LAADQAVNHELPHASVVKIRMVYSQDWNGRGVIVGVGISLMMLLAVCMPLHRKRSSAPPLPPSALTQPHRLCGFHTPSWYRARGAQSD